MGAHVRATERHLPSVLAYLPPDTSERAPLYNPSQTGRYLIYLPRRDWRLSWSWWLINGYIPRWFTCPKTVTHPGTNRARRMATTLIGHSVLTARLRRHLLYVVCSKVPWSKAEVEWTGGAVVRPVGLAAGVGRCNSAQSTSPTRSRGNCVLHTRYFTLLII